MDALKNKFDTLTIDEVVAVVRGLASDSSDEAGTVTDLCLARIQKACSQEFYVALCDELYAAMA